MNERTATGRSADSRASMLARLRSREGEPRRPNLSHPVPEMPPGGPPLVHSHLLDPGDLLGSFVRNATAVGARVTDLGVAEDWADVAAGIVARHGIERAVASKQRLAWPLVEALGAAGVAVGPFDRDSSAAADLGVSVADAAIATTGSVVQRSDTVGGRTVSLLPRVHVCVVPASAIVASSAEVFRRLSRSPEALPSNLVVITGPSKSADIQQVLVTGVHGPVAIELVIVHQERSPGASVSTNGPQVGTRKWPSSPTNTSGVP